MICGVGSYRSLSRRANELVNNSCKDTAKAVYPSFYCGNSAQRLNRFIARMRSGDEHIYGANRGFCRF